MALCEDSQAAKIDGQCFTTMLPVNATDSLSRARELCYVTTTAAAQLVRLACQKSSCCAILKKQEVSTVGPRDLFALDGVSGSRS